MLLMPFSSFPPPNVLRIFTARSRRKKLSWTKPLTRWPGNLIVLLGDLISNMREIYTKIKLKFHFFVIRTSQRTNLLMESSLDKMTIIRCEYCLKMWTSKWSLNKQDRMKEGCVSIQKPDEPLFMWWNARSKFYLSEILYPSRRISMIDPFQSGLDCCGACFKAAIEGVRI